MVDGEEGRQVKDSSLLIFLSRKLRKMTLELVVNRSEINFF